MKGYLIAGRYSYYNDSNYVNNLKKPKYYLTKDKAEQGLKQLVLDNLDEIQDPEGYRLLRDLTEEEINRLNSIEEIYIEEYNKDYEIGYTTAKDMEDTDAQFVYSILEERNLIPYEILEIEIEE